MGINLSHLITKLRLNNILKLTINSKNIFMLTTINGGSKVAIQLNEKMYFQILNFRKNIL